MNRVPVALLPVGRTVPIKPEAVGEVPGAEAVVADGAGEGPDPGESEAVGEGEEEGEGSEDGAEGVEGPGGGEGGECDPGPELCNLADDDCDGEIDEDTAGLPCQLGQGECSDQGTSQCVGGGVICDAVPGEPVVEICDGLDNDAR